MQHFFNNAGPSVAGKHYLIDPLRRIDVAYMEDLIAEERYFVLHAPRQTGKTTCLLSLMEHLNQQGNYQTLYVNIESAQAARANVQRGISAVVEAIGLAAEVYLQDTSLIEWLDKHRKQYAAESLLRALLQHWSIQSAKPTVLFLDEVDALVGDTLVSLLRQIRGGYAQRPAAFPVSIILCGIRDVRDYRIQTKHQEIITGGSAFNIKAIALRLGNFSELEVHELWQQHTAIAGQTIAEEIYPELWADTQGQPWLVNALGYMLTRSPEMRYLRDPKKSITLEEYRKARELLILSRATHLDQLVDKLGEPRVHRVMTAILSNADDESNIPPDDVQYVADLGLISLKPGIRISNRIYQETIPRELTWSKQMMMTQQQAWYLTPQRRLDMPKLLAAFQQYFRENSEAWIEQFDYKEAGPQLLLQAFLQRIVNGGGRISREYGLGRKRTDLYIEWPVDEQAGFQGEVQRIVLELKLRHQSLEVVEQKGLKQTADYADQSGAEEAHLLIFDRRPTVAWEEKIKQKTVTEGGRDIMVWGL